MIAGEIFNRVSAYARHIGEVEKNIQVVFKKCANEKAMTKEQRGENTLENMERLDMALINIFINNKEEHLITLRVGETAHKMISSLYEEGT